MATGSLKPFEDAVKDAQQKYDEYVADKELNQKLEDLSLSKKEYENNRNIYEQLDDEYGIVNGQYLAALENYNKLDGDLQTAEAARNTFVDNAYAQYVDDHPNTPITKDAFEDGLASGLDIAADLYGKENIEKYQEHTDTINALSDDVDIAEKLKNDLLESSNAKKNQRDQYNVDGMLEEIARKQDVIDAIKADDEYTSRLTALKNAQEEYNRNCLMALAQKVLMKLSLVQKTSTLTLLHLNGWRQQGYCKCWHGRLCSRFVNKV